MIQIIITILAYSLFATMIRFISDNEIGLGIILGPVGWVWLLIHCIYEHVTSWVQYHDKRSILINPKDNRAYAIPCKQADDYLDIGWQFINKEGQPATYEYLLSNAYKWNKNHITRCSGQIILNVRYCPKSVWKGKIPEIK